MSEPTASSDLARLPLVSYAPNGEDIVLWRALQQFTPGYFVDVGACHPIESSITKLFSLRGWTGINIEPLPHLIELLDADRPDDVNIRAGLSDESGDLTLYVVIDDYQRTTLSKPLADLYRDEGYAVEEHSTPVRTLTDVLADHPLARIDFLKIDAEGMEDAIVRGLDLDRFRPTVIVAEEGSHQSYEFPELLAEAGYVETLWDGLNRFFVDGAAGVEVRAGLSSPAGPLDQFIKVDHHDARRRAAEAEALADELQRRIDALERHIDDIHRSSTWRIGAALHAPVRAIRTLRRR